MKKTIIGTVLLLSGIIVDMFLILTASLALPHVMAWSTSYPSKLFFLIFAGKSQSTDGADGLGLGLFFVFGIILIILGLIILAIEYLKEDKGQEQVQ